jgi:8-oxo-dGTP pyrophosphatase MutT (NUDIX family)
MEEHAARRTIRIAAAIIMNAAGHTLLVRKRGTRSFMQAGGKIEIGETPREALSRELLEELGIEVPTDMPEHLGRFVAPAAHEVGHLVAAELFRLTICSPVRPTAEIEEIAWVDPVVLPLAQEATDRKQLM